MLMLSIVAITLALVLYSIGIWGERLQKTLKPWHVALFWAGLLCDATGTLVMSSMAGGTGLLSFHGITGAAAILLMLFNAVWATLVLVRRNEAMKKSYHRLGLVVWCIWLVPYLSGVVVGMGG